MNILRMSGSSLGLMLGALAFGQVSLVSSPFVGSDSIQWSQFGVSKTDVPNPAYGLTALGQSFTASATSSFLYLLQQGNGWNGDFPNSDFVIYTAFGPLQITGLDDYVVGAFVQMNYTQNSGLPMDLSAYNGSTLLGTVSEPVVSAEFSAGTATFLGISSTSPITSVDFSFPVADFEPQHFAVDAIQLTPNSVPEPPDAAPLALALIVFLRRRRK